MAKTDSEKGAYSPRWRKGQPFTILCREKGELMIPLVYSLPCGDLLVSYLDNGDVFFATQKLLRSKDGGCTWR